MGLVAENARNIKVNLTQLYDLVRMQKIKEQKKIYIFPCTVNETVYCQPNIQL